MFFTDNQIKEIAALVEKYVNVSEHPNENNNILIKNNTISLIVDGQIILSKQFDPLILKSQIEQIPYGKNVFLNKNFPFSPLDADRDENKHIWKDKYTKINFPKFVFVVLLAFIVTDTIPSVLDLLFIYANAYIEPIPYNEFSNDDKRHALYSDDFFVRITNDRERLNKITKIENQSLTNILIRFKDNYYKNYTHGLPFHEFTMEQLACRIHKAYASIIRDIFNAFYISSFGLATSYSLRNDLNGVDLSVEGVPIYSFIKSKSSYDFHEIKKEERHKLKFGIKLITNLSNGKSGVYLITDDAVNQIINIVKNKTINKFYNVEF